MTLGQRIQELRKQKNLSQEALGEAMGVSRQAISKWESDITIPEVDKLIAMSKQFGVSVGVLLGVEEPAAEQEQATQELTDRELAAVETIVSRYIEQMEQLRPEPQPSAPRMSAGKKGALTACAVLLLIAAVKTVSDLNDRIDSLRHTTGNIQSQVLNVENTVTRQIYSLSDRLEKLLEEQGSLLASWNCELVGPAPDSRARFELTAAPKEYVPGMEAVFFAESVEGEKVSAKAVWNGTGFAAELDVPLWDRPVFSVIFQDGATQKLQVMNTQAYYLKDAFNLIMDSASYSESIELSRDNVLKLDISLTTSLKVQGAYGGILQGKDQVWPEEVWLRVYYRGAELDRIPLNPENWDLEEGAGEWAVRLDREYAVDGQGGALHVSVGSRSNLGQESEFFIIRRNDVGYGKNKNSFGSTYSQMESNSHPAAAEEVTYVN